MKSPVVKRSIVIAGHKTSGSLEDAFWKGLKEIANGRELTLSDLVASIDTDRRHGNLSSAIRASCTQFCEPIEEAGCPALRGAGAGLISIGAGNAGACSFLGDALPRNCDGAFSIARNVFV